MAVSADYHHRQAQVLTRLADKTRDAETARALLQLAAEHVQLAEQNHGQPAAVSPGGSNHDGSHPTPQAS